MPDMTYRLSDVLSSQEARDILERKTKQIMLLSEGLRNCDNQTQQEKTAIIKKMQAIQAELIRLFPELDKN